MTARHMLPILAAALAAIVAGCASGMRFAAIRPGINQTLRVESGDRLFFDMGESSTPRGKWDFECDDPDVSVSIAHRDGMARAELHIHRGYDGPSKIVFFRRGMHGKDQDRFVITLFRRTGDAAFWE